jgi:hypothetical protein
VSTINRKHIDKDTSRREIVKKLIIVLAIAVLLIGCTSRQALMAEGNWQQVGYNAGNMGHKADSEEALKQQVEKSGTQHQVNFNQYQEGYEKGISRYCSSERMYQFGLEKRFDWGVCEFRREQKGLYLSEWQRGLSRGPTY